MAERKTTTKTTAVKATAPKVPAVKAKATTKPAASFYASARFVHVAPRKLRLVCDQLRGQSAAAALTQLQFRKQHATRSLEKLLRSAMANATQTATYQPVDLIISTLTVNEGPKLKRSMPRAHGRASMILKRMSHVQLTITPKAGAVATAKTNAAPTKSEPAKIVSPEEARTPSPKAGKQSGDADKGGAEGERGFIQKVFNRKTG